MVKKYIFLLLILSFCANAQVLDEYPENQHFYEGGLVGLYKDSHQLLVDKKQKDCDPQEIYQPRILITKDSTVKLIADGDSVNINKNKYVCPFLIILL